MLILKKFKGTNFQPFCTKKKFGEIDQFSRFLVKPANKQNTNRSFEIRNNMSIQSFSVLKQLKSEFKQCSIINNQISNQELESLQLINTQESPLSGNSQCMTEDCSFIKTDEKMIEEYPLDIQCELIYSELDDSEYYRQTLIFTTMNEIKQAIQKIKHSQNIFMMPINEIQIDTQSNQTYKLGIITKKFINHIFTINIKALCRFIAKVIKFEISFSNVDIIQYYDESIHINPISLLIQHKKQTYYEALKEMLTQVNICENIKLILEMLKDFQNKDLEKLKSYNVIDKDIYKLELQLINLLYKRMQI